MSAGAGVCMYAHVRVRVCVCARGGVYMYA